MNLTRNGLIVLISVIFVAGAAIWLVLIEVNLAILGIIVLAVASFLEHNLAVNLALREDPQLLK